MTDILLRLFVKDSDNISSAKVRNSIGTFSGIVGIICNVLLCIAKFVIGSISGSVSITADAVNNLSDASGSVVTLIGFKLASKPADEKHPYGHQRIEYFAGLTVAVLMCIVGFELGRSSVEKIIHPTGVEFSAALVTVLILSCLLKLWMMLFFGKLGKKMNSSTLLATSADSRNDVITTGVVLVSCVVSRIFGIEIDGYAGLAVAIFILCSAVGIIKDTVNPLLGAAPDTELVKNIADTVKSHKGVLGIHDLIVHDYGPGRRYASVHAEFDYRTDVLEAHEIIDDTERDVKRDMNIELVIHFDPVVTDDEEVNSMRDTVAAVVEEIDSRMRIHDFRMGKGNGHTNVIFDLVIPHEYDERKDELKKIISAKIQKNDMVYFAVITFDSASFNEI